MFQGKTNARGLVGLSQGKPISNGKKSPVPYLCNPQKNAQPYPPTPPPPKPG